MRTPYTKWAGMSNIPEAIKDKYGNPQGSQYDLVEDGSFQGYKIVVLNLCDECYFDQPKIALEKKGFEVVEYVTLPPIFSLMLFLLRKCLLLIIIQLIVVLEYFLNLHVYLLFLI